MSKRLLKMNNLKNNPNKGTFWGHLDELRYRLIRCICAVISAAVVLYYFVDPVLDFIIRPIGKIVFTSVTDAFVVRIQLALLMGFFISLPYVVWQVWAFVAVGLKAHEQKYIFMYGPCSAVVFFLGGIFAYTVIVPISLQFLLGFATETMVPMITVKNYVSFVGTMVIAFGVVFELPVVMLFLTQIGVATPNFLIHYRRHSIVAIVILCAIITPPDCITQLIMSVPLILLYEAGIIASKVVYSKRAKAGQA